MKNIGTKKLETSRTILRKIEKNDYIYAYKNYGSSKNVSKYVIWPVHKNEKVTKELFDNWINSYDKYTYRWVIELKENHEVIGMIDVSKKYLEFSTCEVGYVLSDNYWNKGIMTEVLSKVLEFLFIKCDAQVVYAQYLENNIASGKVMQKCGMKFETCLRQRVVDKTGKRNDLLVYSLLKNEYLNMKK